MSPNYLSGRLKSPQSPRGKPGTWDKVRKILCFSSTLWSLTKYTKKQRKRNLFQGKLKWLPSADISLMLTKSSLFPPIFLGRWGFWGCSTLALSFLLAGDPTTHHSLTWGLLLILLDPQLPIFCGSYFIHIYWIHPFPSKPIASLNFSSIISCPQHWNLVLVGLLHSGFMSLLSMGHISEVII